VTAKSLSEHAIVLDDIERDNLIEVLETTDKHFAELTHNGMKVCDVPQTEAISAYRAILQSILNKVCAS